MFEGMRLIDTAAKSAASLFGDPHGTAPADLVSRLERALALAKDLAALAALNITVDDKICGTVARLGALLDGIDDCFPKIDAWCVIKHNGGDSAPYAFVPEIAKAYTTAGRRPDRWVVERRLAELSDFIAPTVTPKAYADEIRRYHS